MAARRGSGVGPRSAAVVLCSMFLGASVLAGCRADAEVDEILSTGLDDELDVIVNTCNADLDVDVDESETEVVIDVRNNDRRLFDTGGDDCQDAVRIVLDAPLGDRALRLADGRELTVTTFPVDAAEPELDG